MKINIGSKNKVKIEAVSELLKDYPDFKDAEFFGKEVDSEVSHQPKTLDETIEGAMNRAKNCFDNCEYSFGLESGLMAVPKTKTGHMDITVCAVYDGKVFCLGISSAFEYPIKVTEYIFESGDNISNAFNKLGLTESNNLGSEQGAIGILTKGKYDRKRYTQESIRAAMVHLENKELY